MRTQADDRARLDVDETWHAGDVVEEAVEVARTDLPGLEQNIDFDRQDDSGNTTFVNSGTYEIIWEYETGNTSNDLFKPIAPDGVVRFFGRVDDGVGATDGGDEINGFGPFQDLTGDFITLDEDVISGDTDTPPAAVLQVNVPDTADTGQGVQLQLIYYETSGIEYIQGEDKCFDDPDNREANGNLADRALVQAACTSDEIGDADDPEDNQSFVLNAQSDEDAADDKRQLALLETGRFTGIFQGYVRLTDADGDGVIGEGSSNWGLERGNGEYEESLANVNNAVGDGTNSANPSVAVLAVGDGPVTITYKDSDGRNRTFDVEIDIGPPTISIDSPEHNGRSDDEKPSFIGTFNDSDSGLAAESFQLDVDNTDNVIVGDGSNTPVMWVASMVSGANDEETAQVRRRLDYTGYDLVKTQFGVVDYMVYLADDVGESATTGTGAGGSKTHKSLEADDFADGAPDGEFNGEREVDFDEFVDNADFEFNHAIDFQAVVRDLAGNVGFSDSDPSNPRFIDALGEEEPSDRADGDSDDVNGARIHNVLGVYSKHVVYVDDKDPSIVRDRSVTGFYGLDDDKNLVRNRSAVMVVFDGEVNGELIDTGTFSLEHDEETAIEVVDVAYSGKLVFLKLGEELASDARPTLSLSEGREVEDLAGNLLSWQESDAEAFQVRDGILPVFKLSLGGGSGNGVGREGPTRLTKLAMDVSIDSDEDITGSPNVNVVCTSIGDPDDDDFGLSNFVANRTGYNSDDVEDEPAFQCSSSDEARMIRHSASLSRPGNNWVYAWRNTSSQDLDDGELAVVVWGRDRSDYQAHDGSGANYNWGSKTVNFVLDDTFNSPLNKNKSGGSVQPEPDSEVKEPRPFVYLDFAGEMTSVTVTSLTVDGEDVLGDLSSVGDNRFLYWPEALDFGTHEVTFYAHDAANNELKEESFEFNVTARDPFVIDLTAGWNAISVPADPIDTALDAVFTEEAIDRVVGWNPLSSTGPWSIATRIDGVWTTSANFAPLTDIVVRYGYWVHSMAFVEQSVDLKGQLDRESGENPTPVGIITVPGWNFVGVVDQDGDQTEGDWAEPLMDNEGVEITADDYMLGYRQAYTWDAIANGYRVLDGDKPMVIGQGIWVFFPDDTTIAP